MNLVKKASRSIRKTLFRSPMARSHIKTGVSLSISAIYRNTGAVLLPESSTLLIAQNLNRSVIITSLVEIVIASREDGLFRLHYINQCRPVEDKRLDVCQKCLDQIKYKGFRFSMRQNVRLAAVKRFSIAEFFATYPKTLHHSMPAHTDQTAPKNEYSPDWPVISRAYRQKRNWVCETCSIALSKNVMQRYLHVHHINGLKNENNDENLKSRLCPLSRGGTVAWSHHCDAPIP